MADIDVNIYEAVTNRDGVSTPVSGVISGDPLPNPLNPPTGNNYTAGIGLTLTGKEFKVGDEQNIFFRLDGTDNVFQPVLSNGSGLLATHYSVTYATDSQSGFRAEKNVPMGTDNKNAAVFGIASDDRAYIQIKTTNTSDSNKQIGFLIDNDDIGGSKFEVVDDVNLKGMVYKADYSANYTNRSLVDKEYVDGLAGVTPPIDGSYASQAAMIADQSNQTAQYIYFDGTLYWEYLGTVLGTIADYRQISGGGSDTNKVSYNVADGKTATERRQARDNINVSSGIPQTIATTGTLTVTRTSNCLIFTGAGAVRLDTVDAGLDGEEIIVINRTGQSLDVNSTASTVNSFSGQNGIRNGSNAVYRYYGSRWNLINDTSGLTSSAALGDNAYPLRVYKSNGTTEILAVRSQGNVYITGLGNTTVAPLVVQVDSAGATNQIARFLNNSGSLGVAIINDSTIFMNARSTGAAYVVRRDELPFNYPQTVATAGTINNLSLTNEAIKLLILTAATDLTGVLPVTTTTGRLLRIEGRVGGGVIIRHESASSTAANRFTLPGAVDLTIANGEVYTFIYTNGRWRRAL